MGSNIAKMNNFWTFWSILLLKGILHLLVLGTVGESSMSEISSPSVPKTQRCHTPFNKPEDICLLVLLFHKADFQETTHNALTLLNIAGILKIRDGISVKTIYRLFLDIGYRYRISAVAKYRLSVKCNRYAIPA